MPIVQREARGIRVIQEMDRKLKDWATAVVEPASVRFEAPGPTAASTGAGVGLYLMELADAPPSQETRRAAQRLSLRYLVTSWAETPEEAHRLLGLLVFAALERDDVEVDLRAPLAATWRAFGVAPRPCFVLQVPLRRERPREVVPRVRGPLVTRAVPSGAWGGVVLGPNDVPLASVVVELPGLSLSTETDFRGRFRFSRVPSEPRAQLVRVRAKGQVRDFTAEPPEGEGDPLTIRFALQEG